MPPTGIPPGVSCKHQADFPGNPSAEFPARSPVHVFYFFRKLCKKHIFLKSSNKKCMGFFGADFLHFFLQIALEIALQKNLQKKYLQKFAPPRRRPSQTGLPPTRDPFHAESPMPIFFSTQSFSRGVSLRARSRPRPRIFLTTRIPPEFPQTPGRFHRQLPGGISCVLLRP